MFSKVGSFGILCKRVPQYFGALNKDATLENYPYVPLQIHVWKRFVFPVFLCLSSSYEP